MELKPYQRNPKIPQINRQKIIIKMVIMIKMHIQNLIHSIN
jgi:hypothetical protein